jgi:CRP-like cAMP-binding protein
MIARMSSTVEALTRVPLFANLGQRQLKRLARLCKERQYGPGRAVVRQGQMSGVGFFVIVEGEASVSVDGREVARLGPGDFFGELALISRELRTATVTAETELRCLVLAFWDFRSFAKDNPDVSWKMMEHLVELVAEERRRRSLAGLQSS